MKLIVATALAAAAIITAPAMAAPRTHHGAAYQYDPNFDATAQYNGPYGDRSTAADVVVSGGHVQGQDPDPAVRLMLRKDSNISDN